MDTIKKSFIIFLICLLGFLTIVKSEICPTFSCGSLPNSLCANRTSNITADLQTYILQNCTNKNEQCPFYNVETSDSLTCEQKPIGSIKLYPGGPCADNTDCILGNCANSTCTGTANGKNCVDHKECNYGYACYLSGEVSATVKQCLPQKKEAESCTEDFDCYNTHGCNNSTCTRYFSLPNGHPVESTPAKYLSFCQSGYEYNNACASLKQPQAAIECNDDTPCNYINFDGSSIVIPQNCLCGFNSFGKKFCKLGSGHSQYKAYVNTLESLIKDNSNCSTEERGACNYNRKFPSKEFTLTNQQFINAQIIGEYYHELITSDSCVINVVYPEYVPDAPVPPTPTPNNTDFTCAKYQCKNKQANCTNSHYSVLENNTLDISVVLSDICKSTEFCNVGGKPNDVFYEGFDVIGTCKIMSAASGPLRYPGELCVENKDCFAPDATKYNETLVGTCKNGVCQGYSSGQNCSETAWCTIGNYCNTEGKCASLKRQNDACNKTTECRNNLLCYKGTCQNVWYKLDDNVKITGDGDFEAEFYCKFGRATNGVCDTMNTTDTVDLKNNLVSCTPGQKCNYTTNFGAIQQNCECGYNGEGLSYCPKGNNQEPENWVRLGLSKARKISNECHSESRAECYMEDGDLLAAVKDYEHQTESAHLYYGAPGCTIRVLSSSFLKVSIATLIISLITLILF